MGMAWVPEAKEVRDTTICWQRDGHRISLKGSSQHKVGGEWFEIKLGKISRMLVKYEVLPIPNVIFVC